MEVKEVNARINEGGRTQGIGTLVRSFYLERQVKSAIRWVLIVFCGPTFFLNVSQMCPEIIIR